MDSDLVNLMAIADQNSSSFNKWSILFFQKNHSMLLVTPQKASLIECTEVSQVFCDDDIEGLKVFFVNI